MWVISKQTHINFPCRFPAWASHLSPKVVKVGGGGYYGGGWYPRGLGFGVVSKGWGLVRAGDGRGS